MSLIKPVPRELLYRIDKVLAQGELAKKRAEDEQAKKNNERRADT